jgi:hypothetical protein
MICDNKKIFDNKFEREELGKRKRQRRFWRMRRR